MLVHIPGPGILELQARLNRDNWANRRHSGFKLLKIDSHAPFGFMIWIHQVFLLFSVLVFLLGNLGVSKLSLVGALLF